MNVCVRLHKEIMEVQKQAPASIRVTHTQEAEAHFCFLMIFPVRPSTHIHNER